MTFNPIRCRSAGPAHYVFFMVATIALACLLVIPAPAAEITLTAGQHEYFFLTGQPAEIPLIVTSTFPKDTAGTLLFSTDTQLQKPGTIMIRTENRVSTRTIPAGTSSLNLSGSTAATPVNYKVHISLYYSGPGPVKVTLPEIIVHIVSGPAGLAAVPSPLKSVSAPGTGNVPASSSVEIHEQPASVREQSGSDSATGPGPASGAGAGINATALREQQARDQAGFDDRLVRDPLYAGINESLTGQGFSIRTSDTRPSSAENGSFSIVYGKGTDAQVILSGIMQGGIVPSLSLRSNTAIPSTPALDSNQTIALFDQELAGKGYRVTETLLDRTLTNAMVNVSYTDQQGGKAFIRATDEKGNVTSISRGPVTEPFTGAVVTLIAAAVVAGSGVFLYRRNRSRRAPPGGDGNVSRSANASTGEVSLRILKSAEEAYSAGRHREAYGIAGQSVRSYYAKGAGDTWKSMTSTDLITLLEENSSPDLPRVREIITQCTSVEFAKGEPDDQEFSHLTGLIREILLREQKGRS